MKMGRAGCAVLRATSDPTPPPGGRAGLRRAVPLWSGIVALFSSLVALSSRQGLLGAVLGVAWEAALGPKA